jgi:hypothetical protein
MTGLYVHMMPSGYFAHLLALPQGGEPRLTFPLPSASQGSSLSRAMLRWACEPLAPYLPICGQVAFFKKAAS